MTDWNKVKDFYDAGMSDQELANKFNIKKNTVKVHRLRNNWGKANRKKRVSSVPKKNVSVSKNKTDTDTKIDTDTIVPSHVDEVIEQSGLRDRQKLFCSLYLKYYNATKAYQEAYGVKYDTAMRAGSRLLSNVDIQETLKQLRDEQTRTIFADTTDVLLDYLKQMRANISDYIDSRTVKTQRLDENGNPVSDVNGEPIYDYQTEIWLKDLTDVDLSVVDEIHKGKDGIIVKMAPRQHAMDKLMNYLPEPVDDKPHDNTFLSALLSSVKEEQNKDKKDE